MSNRSWKYCFWIILLLGITLRMAEYIALPSLWMDEAIVANRIARYPLFALAQIGGPTAVHLSYPVGFLFVEQLSFLLFGLEDAVLRMFPLLTGLLSLFVFAKLSRKIFQDNWALLALFIFSISRNLVYYANEVKPYSSDVFFAVLIWFVLLDTKWRDLSLKQVCGLGLLGVWCCLFSFPAFFLLIGIGTGLMIYAAVRKDLPSLRPLVLAMFFWMLGFMIYYAVSLQYFSKDATLTAAWSQSYLPLADGFYPCFKWLVVSFKRIFSNGLDMPAAAAGLAFILGLFYAIQQKREELFGLAFPILFVVLLSAPRFYPFEGRVILFLLPAFILLVTRGIQMICRHVVIRNKRIFVAIILFYFLFFPVLFSSRQFRELSGPEEIKPVLSYIAKHQRENDLVAIYRGSQPAYQFYAEKYDLTLTPFVINRHNIQDFLQHKIKTGLPGEERRVWFIFTHVTHGYSFNERLSLLQRINACGEKMDQVQIKVLPKAVPLTTENNLSASGYLYRFQGKG